MTPIPAAERIARLDALTAAQQRRLLLWLDSQQPRTMDKALDYQAAWDAPAAQSAGELDTRICEITAGSEPAKSVIRLLAARHPASVEFALDTEQRTRPAAEPSPVPACGTRHPYPHLTFTCVLLQGHDGDHAASGPDDEGNVHDTWPQDQAEPDDAAPAKCRDKRGSFRCTLPAGHDGDHRAEDWGGEPFGTWLQPARPECGASDGDGTTCPLPAGHDGPHGDECGAVDGSWICNLPSGHPGHHGYRTPGAGIGHHWPHASRPDDTAASAA